ncbi:MAG: hypothetical protein ACFCAD_04225, partial [Pleurocapsa sp.]
MVHNSPNLDSLRSAWQEKYQAKKKLQTTKSVNFQIQQGDRFLACDQLSEALTCYRHALKINPNSTEAKQRLVKTINQQKELVQAKNNHPQPSISLTPHQQDNDTKVVAQVYLQQAQSLEAEGKWQKAIVSCQEALKFDSQLAEAYKIWGDILHKLCNLTEAIGYYAKALV